MIKKIYSWFFKFTAKKDEAGEYSAGYWQRRVRETALELCWETEHGRVLEVGCGEGFFLQALASQHPTLEIWGVDNSGPRVELATKRLVGKNVRVSLQEAARLDFETEYFDTVVCVNVFLNLPTFSVLRQAFNQIHRVCKKSGKIIFDFRNADNLMLNLKYKLAPYYDATVRKLPLKTYRPEQIETVLKELNFKIIHKKTIGLAIPRYAPIIIIEAQKLC